MIRQCFPHYRVESDTFCFIHDSVLFNSYLILYKEFYLFSL
nr:MAG TPA_asm: hypothetical protein [Caudoviricetes sp.]